MAWNPQITLAGTFFAAAALAGLVGLWVFGGDPQTEQRLGELADPQSLAAARAALQQAMTGISAPS